MWQQSTNRLDKNIFIVEMFAPLLSVRFHCAMKPAVRPKNTSFSAKYVFICVYSSINQSSYTEQPSGLYGNAWRELRNSNVVHLLGPTHDQTNSCGAHPCTDISRGLGTRDEQLWKGFPILPFWPSSLASLNSSHAYFQIMLLLVQKTQKKSSIKL